MNSFEKELSDRRTKEVQLKSEISTVEQERKNALQKENETHEKFVHVTSKFEKEKKISADLKSEVDRLLHEIQFCSKKRDEILEKNNVLRIEMEKKEKLFQQRENELGKKFLNYFLYFYTLKVSNFNFKNVKFLNPNFQALKFLKLNFLIGFFKP